MSTRITKSEAAKVALLMVNATIEVKRTELQKQMSDLMTPVVRENIHPQILDAFAKFPKFFGTSSHIKPAYRGIVEIGVTISSPIPTDQGWGITVETPKNIYDKLIKLERKREKLREESRELKNNIYETLYSLGTFKKIKDQFPAAYAYIPEEWLSNESTGIALPIEQLTKELEKYI